VSRGARVHLKGTLEEIWNLLNDPRSGPYWQAEWKGVTRFSPKFEARAWRESRAGSPGFVFELEERVGPQRLVLRQAGGAGRWVHELTVAAEGIVVGLREEGKTRKPGGWLAALLGGGGNAVEKLLRDLSRRAGQAGAPLERI
jgi:hypothetical protein